MVAVEAAEVAGAVARRGGWRGVVCVCVRWGWVVGGGGGGGGGGSIGGGSSGGGDAVECVWW